MTTQTYTSVIDHTSDAGFRAWGSEIGVNLAIAGLVQTSDTGQINWATVLRPGASTSGGYEVWRFADSSIFFKLEFGTAGPLTAPQMWVTVGTGSNGSGSITGQSSTRNIFTAAQTPTSTSTNCTTYICVLPDCFSIVWKANGTNSGTVPLGMLCVGKTVDSAGATTTTGYGVLRQQTNGSPTLQSVRLASPSATNSDTVNCILFPGNPSNSQTGINIQAYLIWLNVHQVIPFEWACGYVIAEQLKLTPFAVSLISTPSHNYLPIGLLGSAPTLNGQAGTVYSLALIYE